MTGPLSSRTLCLGSLLALSFLLGACGPRTTARAGNSQGSTPATHTGPASPAVTAGEDHGEEESGTLGPARRVQLGLFGTGAIPVPTPQQWADPQAVAARFVLADTTYAATEDPATVTARRAAYATPRLAADLATSSSGAARLDELRRRQGRFTGEVLSITTSQENGELAVVHLSVAVVLTGSDQPPDRRVRFYELTLGREFSRGRWLVARVEQS